MTNTRHRRLTQEWLGLQRCRALTLASLLDINEQLEDIGGELRHPPLGDLMPQSTSRWIERCIDEAVAAEIIDEREIVTA